MEHESDGDTSCNWCTWWSHQRIVRRIGGLINEATCCHSDINERPSVNPGLKYTLGVMLYTHLPYHNDSIIKTHAERRKRKTQEETTQDKDAGRLL